MAIAVIVGILFATFLTLVLVPVMYSMTEDMMGWFRRMFVGEMVEEQR
jgi:Cu/Ag efflux pump CusA